MIDPRPAPVAIAEQRKLHRCWWRRGQAARTFFPLPGTRLRSRRSLSSSNPTIGRPVALLGADASEPELDRLAASGELGRFGFIHLATHGVIDEGDSAATRR